jgi:hypothetical protein
MPLDPDTEIQYRKGGKVKKKPKKFFGGGITEGENANIDADTRARAIAAVKERMESGNTSSPAPAPAPTRKTAKPVRSRVAQAFAEGDTNDLKVRDKPRKVGMLEALDTKLRAALAPKEPKSADVYKKGGKVAKYARGGGIERKGKTRGKMC